MARGNRLARLAALGLLGAVTLTGCEMPNNEFWRFGWPEGVTDRSQYMRELWTGSVIAALVVGILVWGLILYSVVRHRKRSDELPKQTAYNLLLLESGGISRRPCLGRCRQQRDEDRWQRAGESLGHVLGVLSLGGGLLRTAPKAHRPPRPPAPSR